jgi:hypothetical protein
MNRTTELVAKVTIEATGRLEAGELLAKVTVLVAKVTVAESLSFLFHFSEYLNKGNKDSHNKGACHKTY